MAPRTGHRLTLEGVTHRFGEVTAVDGIDLGIADPEQHYHLPFKLTPWGYSCFRGGA